MTKEEARKRIQEVVVDMQGCKGTELALRLANIEELIKSFSSEEIVGLIDDVIMNGDLVEVQYTLPIMTYRIKTFLLPKGTKVEIAKY